MESKEYFEKVMQDYNQNRNGRSLRKYCKDEAIDYNWGIKYKKNYPLQGKQTEQPQDAFIPIDKNKNMNLQKKLSAIQAETAAANARAAASKHRTLELETQSLKMELEIRKLLAAPNFPEETKQRILAQLRKLNSED